MPTEIGAGAIINAPGHKGDASGSQSFVTVNLSAFAQSLTGDTSWTFRSGPRDLVILVNADTSSPISAGVTQFASRGLGRPSVETGPYLSVEQSGSVITGFSGIKIFGPLPSNGWKDSTGLKVIKVGDGTNQLYALIIRGL